MNEILKKIDLIPPGSFLVAKDLLPENPKEAQVALEAQLESGQLMRYGTWLYWKPTVTIIGPAPADPWEVLLRLARGQRVVPAGVMAHNILHLTTQVPAVLVVASSGPIEWAPPGTIVLVRDLGPLAAASDATCMVIDALSSLESIAGEGVGALRTMVNMFRANWSGYPPLTDVLRYAASQDAKTRALAGLLGDLVGGIPPGESRLSEALLNSLDGEGTIHIRLKSQRWIPDFLLWKWHLG